MLELLLFIAMGVVVSNHGRPLQLAGVTVVGSAVLSLMFGASLVEIFFSSVILYAYTAFVYMLVERFSDSILATFGILVSAVAIMIGAVLFV